MDRIITVLGMLGIIAGSLFAIAQDELKRRLAFLLLPSWAMPSWEWASLIKPPSQGLSTT